MTDNENTSEVGASDQGGENPKPSDGINDQTGEFGPGVDQDTGAGVGDTGTPELAAHDAQESDGSDGD